MCGWGFLKLWMDLGSSYYTVLENDYGWNVILEDAPKIDNVWGNMYEALKKS